MRNLTVLMAFFVLGLVSSGCPKNIPQPEIDAAENAIASIEDTKDCAPETYRAAHTMMDRAKALIQEQRYDEAKTAMLAAKNLADQARRECDQKKDQAPQAQEDETAPTDENINEIDMNPENQAPPMLDTIFFGFNESMITDEARQTLNKNAEILRQFPLIRIQIEGHCDDRGSTEYNLALGERRAMAVKQYLIKLGVNPNRMEIISFGEERPLQSGQTEDAWSKNRRAEFSVLQ